MGEKRWAILCPGPSLVDVSHIEGRMVVAVNHAILYPGEFMGAWVVHDPPVNLYRRSPQVQSAITDKLAITKAEIWCNEAHAYLYRGLWPLSSVDPHLRSPRAAIEGYCGYSSETSELQSLGIAIAKAVSRGAREITLYGVDMEGAHDHDPRDGSPLPNRLPSSAWEARWQREHVWLQRLKAWLFEHRGVRIYP